MNIDVSEVVAMLGDYADDLKESKDAANEVVEETLRALGYSKRNKENVRKLFKKAFDWFVKSNGVKTAIKVEKLGTDLDSVATSGLFKQAMADHTNVLIVTDSKTYNVFRYSKVSNTPTYIKIDSFSVDSLTDRNLRVLEAISLDGADIKVLDAIISEGTLSKTDLVALLQEYLAQRKVEFNEFIADKKPSCNAKDIDEKVGDLINSIGKSLLTPNELRDNYDNAEKKYVELLTQKGDEIHELNKRVEELIEKNAEIQHELDVLSKKDYKYAVETLEYIAKNSCGTDKRFAGYINDEIYTSSKLHKFIGMMLQKLYEIKSVEAHAYIFDGEYFRLNSVNAKNNDMVIKNTVYDIMLSDDEAVDALIRLRTIYSHFPDIIFACMETGFGVTKHNTGIADELLEMSDDTVDEELDSCIDADIEIIDKDSSTNVTDNIDENDAEPTAEDYTGMDEQSTCDTATIETDTQDSTQDNVEDTTTDNQDAQVVTPENKDTNTESDEHTEITSRDLLIKHIIGLEYNKSTITDKLSDYSIPNVDLLTGYETNDTVEEQSYDADNKQDSLCDTQDELASNQDEFNGTADNDNSEFELKEQSISTVSLAKEYAEDTKTQESLDSDIEDIVELDETDSDIEDADDSELEYNEETDYSTKSEQEEQVNTEINQYNEEDQYIDEQSDVSDSVLIVTALSAANSLVSDYADDFEFLNIEAVTAEEVAFNVNSDYFDLTYDELLVKSLNAVLAIDIYSDINSKVITKLKHKRLDELSEFIQVRSEDLAEFPVIAGTKYVVCGIENISDLVYTLTRICQSLSLDISKVYMFMSIATESEVIKDNFGTTFDSIQFRNTKETYQQGDNENTTISLIRGELFNNLLVTGSSLKAYEDIFKKVLGVKTTYMELNIDGTTYKSLDAVACMLREAENQNIGISNAKFGLAFGTKYKLLSFDPDEVGDNAHEIELSSGDIIYCAELEEWQMVVSLIKIHNVLFSNSPIIIKTQVDMDAINFYGSEYDTEVSTDSLAICGLAHYVRNHFPEMGR